MIDCAFAVGDWFNRNASAFNAFFAFAVAVFTGYLAWLTAGLWRATKEAADAAKRSADVAERTLTELERPYIFLETPSFEGLPENLKYVFTNYGRTPGIIRWVRASAKKDGKTIWSEIFDGQVIFGPAEAKEIAPLTRTPIAYPKSDIGDEGPLLFVEVTYFDVFDYVHFSEFVFFESLGTFYPIAGQRYRKHKSQKLEGSEGVPPFSITPTG